MQIVHGLFFVVGQRSKARAFAVFQKRLYFIQSRQYNRGFFLLVFTHNACGTVRLFNALFDRIQVGKGKFHIDCFDIVGRIYFIGDVHNVVVVEAAHHVRQNADFAYMRQKLISQPFSFRRAFYQTGNIDEFDGSRNTPF